MRADRLAPTRRCSRAARFSPGSRALEADAPTPSYEVRCGSQGPGPTPSADRAWTAFCPCWPECVAGRRSRNFGRRGASLERGIRLCPSRRVSLAGSRRDTRRGLVPLRVCLLPGRVGMYVRDSAARISLSWGRRAFCTLIRPIGALLCVQGRVLSLAFVAQEDAPARGELRSQARKRCAVWPRSRLGPLH
jgi:hypothetical protein